MKNYTDKTGIIYSYDDDISKEILDAKIKELGLTSITDTDLTLLRLPKLEDAKVSKTNEINKACGIEIVNGFKSNALGTEHIYQSEQTDQLNLIGVVTAGQDDYFKCGVESKDADGVVVSVAWDYKMHTIAQITQVLKDGKALAQVLLQKANTLKVKIANATTLAELDAIGW